MRDFEASTLWRVSAVRARARRRRRSAVRPRRGAVAAVDDADRRTRQAAGRGSGRRRPGDRRRLPSPPGSRADLPGVLAVGLAADGLPGAAAVPFAARPVRTRSGQRAGDAARHQRRAPRHPPAGPLDARADRGRPALPAAAAAAVAAGAGRPAQPAAGRDRRPRRLPAGAGADRRAPGGPRRVAPGDAAAQAGRGAAARHRPLARNEPGARQPAAQRALPDRRPDGHAQPPGRARRAADAALRRDPAVLRFQAAARRGPGCFGAASASAASISASFSAHCASTQALHARRQLRVERRGRHRATSSCRDLALAARAPSRAPSAAAQQVPEGRRAVRVDDGHVEQRVELLAHRRQRDAQAADLRA
ncbi:MAG: hypothetical protein MZW92_57745 [Comamonadaceae bacterium]|nr:hypothetical protein [Comamonadaceae bacterium]